MRRSKKQPEYDPNELADLINTPAVGRGVGSHLLSNSSAPVDVTTVATSEAPPVVDSSPATLDTTEPGTIVPGRKSAIAPPSGIPLRPAHIPPTVPVFEEPTAETLKLPTVANSPGALSGTGATSDGCGTADSATTVVTSEASAVVASRSPTVDPTEPASIVPGRKSAGTLPSGLGVAPAGCADTFNMTTVVNTLTTSVDDSPMGRSQVATVVTSPHSNPPARIWISESGEIVPDSRVRRVQAASDALSGGENSLYHFLLHLPALRQTSHTHSVQAGYHALSKGTGLSRKTIQRTIDRLIAKHYIEIETPADIYRRTSTVYRVFAPDAAVERLAGHACTHVAKIGPGVAFVTPLGTFDRQA